MKLARALAIVLLVLGFSAGVADASCSFWDCTVGDDYVQCWMVFCNPRCDYVYAEDCTGSCDRGGCWCRYSTYCFDI